jgi:hypothetical protein
VKHDQNWESDSDGIWYWRVTPYDGAGFAGKSSDGGPNPQPRSFRADYDSLAPNLVYPQYYYRPDNYPSPDTTVSTYPHEDRTAPLPVFRWNRVFDMSGDAPINAYRLQVSTDPQFDTVNWDFETENTGAAPTDLDPFVWNESTLYYWRVCGIGALGPGGCITPWSQIWAVRFAACDTTTDSPPPGSAPACRSLPVQRATTLLRPVDGAELVESTPLFEWFPRLSAASYQIQVSQDPTYSTVVIDDRDNHPANMPIHA